LKIAMKRARQRGEGNPDSEGPAEKPPRRDRQDGDGTGKAQDAEHLREQNGFDSELHSGRGQNRPQKIREAFDSFPDVKNETMPAHEIARISKGNEGIVRYPAKRDRASDRETAKHNEEKHRYGLRSSGAIPFAGAGHARKYRGFSTVRHWPYLREIRIGELLVSH
jgi:hypothetical protein